MTDPPQVTSLEVVVQLPLEQQNALHDLFNICSSTPQDLMVKAVEFPFNT